MAKFGFLSVLEEELDKHLDYDFAMDWDKKNHAVEVTFILEAQNSGNVEKMCIRDRSQLPWLFYNFYTGNDVFSDVVELAFPLAREEGF